MSKMTAAVSPSFNARAKQDKATRPPSFPSESTIAAQRRHKTRDVASRYLGTSSFSSSSFFQSSPSSAKRCQSPTITRTNRPTTPSGTNRPQSTGRRQSVSPRRDSLDRRGSGEVSGAQRMLLLTSGRSLFASFQADSFTGHENRSKLLNSSAITQGRITPEKRKTTSTATSRSVVAQQEKSKLSEQWPRSLQPNCLSRSVDFTDTRKKPSGSGNAVASADLDKVDSSTVGSYTIISETESVSSLKKLPARALRKISVDSPALSPKQIATTRSQQIRPASPSKFGINAASSSPRGTSIARGISPLRGISPSGRMSPVRVRSSSLILNFAVDAKKEKIRDYGFADAHLLRLLHNRLLHWRFANARANVVISAQKMRAEKRLYNACISISKLYDSARAKRIEMQRLKQNLKLIYILNRQMVHLEEWFVVDRDYMGSLVEASEALKGSTLCLPFDCGAMVNVQSVKDAICSAVDVMQAMASSICLLLPKVVKISSLAVELGRVNVKEQGMLDVCRVLLDTISALQVTECSLRTQAIQL